MLLKVEWEQVLHSPIFTFFFFPQNELLDHLQDSVCTRPFKIMEKINQPILTQ